MGRQLMKRSPQHLSKYILVEGTEYISWSKRKLKQCKETKKDGVGRIATLYKEFKESLYDSIRFNQGLKESKGVRPADM